MAPPVSPRGGDAAGRRQRQQGAASLSTLSSPSKRLMHSPSTSASASAALSPLSSSPSLARRPGGVGAPSWDPLYLSDGEIIFATLEAAASIDGGPG